MLRRKVGIWLTTSALALTSLAGGTGCAGLDPKVVWVVPEAAPMQAVVRRADTARAVALNVERIVSNLAVDADSKWIAALAFKKVDVDPLLKDIATDPEYASPDGKKIRVLPAEAWAVLLSKICSQEKAQASLFAELNTDVHAQYAEIAAQAKKVGKLKADIKIEKDAADDPDRASEKADHEKNKKDLEDQLDQLEKDYQPKVDAFKKRLADEVTKASPETKKHFAATAIVLRRALADAKTANSAAAIGWPIAFKGIKEEVKLMVKRIAADAIQAQIGTRPNTDKLTPEIKLSPVSVTIAGLQPADVGRLKLDDAVKDIGERAKNYVVHVLTLPGFIDETRELIALQTDIVDTIIGAGVGTDPVGEDFTPDPPLTATVVATKLGDKRFPVPMESCVVAKPPEPPPPPPPEPTPPPPPPTKGKGGKKPVGKPVKPVKPTN